MVIDHHDQVHVAAHTPVAARIGAEIAHLNDVRTIRDKRLSPPDQSFVNLSQIRLFEDGRTQ